MVLVLFTSVASAQSVQTIDSKAQLASVLCRNAKEETTNELLDKNPQLLNITLWNALLDCASSAQRHGSATKSLDVYKLTLRVANRLKKHEMMATTYYYLGRTYAEMTDLENSIQAYETSRKLFEQAGSEGNLIYVLGDLSIMYSTAEDYEKAQSNAQQNNIHLPSS